MPKEKEEKNSVENKDKKVEAAKIIEEKVEEKIDIKPEEKEDRKSTRLNSSHMSESRMPSSA